MNEYLSLLILFSAGFLSGFINVMAGGGSSLTLPALIFLGLDATVANGTNRIAIIFQSLFAVLSFKKENISNFKMSLLMAAATLPGAILGAILAVKISNETFEMLLGIIMIGIIITMIIPNKRKQYNDTVKDKVNWLIFPAMLGIGFYGAFIQVGVGFLLMAAIHNIFKVNLVYVNMHKVFITLVFTLPALLIFILSGNINWKFGLILAAGNSLGGWLSVKVSVKKGESVIRIVLAATVFVMAVKLIGII